MSVSGIGNLPMLEAVNQFEPVGKKELDRQDFLKLFVTQLQYQDPMKPMDTYEMSSQLAQFSSMEATLRMSDSMDSLLEYQTSQNNLQLISLLDNTVQASGNLVALNEGASTATEFDLEEGTDSCRIEIYNQSGSLVRTIDLGAVTVGTYELSWDGNDNAGKAVVDGPYIYQVKALNLEGNAIGINYRTTGKVTGLSFDTGQALLTLDKYLTISVGDVLQVM
ncbi:MAG: flagellar hook assembly protein FlgD [Proteobacteria bacterium]|nr:flagellar hook assembly protein FlgD [Pseudomonadota bacterium]MBU1686805.1 flagellar hook assembly protein FlgD [Pseudomonadota bacterium]